MKSTNTINTDPLITGWLLTHYGFSSVDQWIENTIKQLLDLTEQTFPPIKLEPLLRHRKITEYHKDYCYNKWEERFTLAHEIAHTFLFDLSISPPRKIFPSVPARVSETLCNKIAAEILMPKWMVKKFLTEYSPTIESRFNIQLFRKIVLSFVKQFDVSPNVVTRRLVEDFNLWNILVLGVGWCSKSSKRGVVRLGKLEIEESGFSIKVYGRRKFESDVNQSYTWRMEWYAKPLWALNELFIPSKGNPSIYLKIVEDLYQSSIDTHWLKKKEPLGAFRLGNLTSHLKKIHGTRESYPVFACFFRKSSESGTLLPFKIKKRYDDLPKRRRTKIITCIPLTLVSEDYQNKEGDFVI